MWRRNSAHTIEVHLFIRGLDVNTEAKEGVVLVTGGSGYVGGWMIVGLLKRGFKVRTTVRDIAREASVRAAVTSQGVSGDGPTFCVADLSADKGWADAVSGCDFVVHVASPMGEGEPKGTDLLGPARDGTLRVLSAAVEAGVKRVVVTSSLAAALPARPGEEAVASDGAVWTDVNGKGVSDYARSKTLAERAAWEFIQQSNGATTLTTILPGMIMGPVMKRSISGSVGVVARLLAGKVPAIPNVGFNIVDVRDLVELHIEAMLAPQAAGQRFLASSDFLWLGDIARLLRENLGDHAAKVTSRRLPDFILRITALFQADARFMVSMIGRRPRFNTALASTLLDWHPRPASVAVLDCARSLLKAGLVPGSAPES
ncbi:NAD-dependent epimerase/dehydratase family protein [Paraburkholderia acidicola]|uniref:NAD-dependent epimerase/dehydratase family protein n=1 Tax=Paraburkholderia acidicola TaxID=1912599 RepID=A0ABV1LN36_9BURK